jgi:hypothetical protein
MQEMEIPVAATQPRKSAAGCCPDEGCGTGLKNNYYEGKRLTPDTFRVEQRYMVERRRLLNRAIHGWGVVFGYSIVVEPRGAREAITHRLKIGEGLALDSCGRELAQVGCSTIALKDVTVVSEHGRPLNRRECDDSFARVERQRVRERDRSCWLLEAHYAEQSIDPVQITDSCRCEQHEWDRVCETVRYTLRRVPCEECCGAIGCELECRCAEGGCCEPECERRDLPHDETTREEIREEVRDDVRDDVREKMREDPSHDVTRPMRGGCRCICDHLTELHPGEDCTCRLCEIDEPCGTVRVDMTHGVPLACVDVMRNECEEWTFGPRAEVCGPRRFVKRNDLLFDLIQGCDLTRISEIGWAHWHRRREPVLLADFLDALGYDGVERDAYVAKRFWVEFSRPVEADTLRADCFAMTVLSRDERERWWTPNRVPIVGVELFPAEPNTSRLVRGAAIIVDGIWLLDAVRSKASIFHDHEARVEVEVRGDFILDCNGQAVDAEAIGRSPQPTGNGAPGGTFLSTFRVARSEHSERRGPSDTAERYQGVSR